MNSILRRLFLTLTAITLVGISAVGEAAAEAALCKFDDSVQSAFERETSEHDSYLFERSDEVMELRFIDIKREDGSARLVGNQGVNDVFAILGSSGLTFLEFTGTGNVNVTTVYSTAATGWHPASHSRHIAFEPDTGLVSQMVGRCLMSTD